MEILHVRPGPNGSLTGYLDEMLNIPLRLNLQEVRVLGTTIMFTLPNGNVLRGSFSNDRRTIVGSQGSPTWQRARTLQQALAEDAEENAKKRQPTDGTWTGVIDHIEWSEIVKTPPKGDFRYVVHLGSAPTSCSVRLEIPSDNSGPYTDVPCEMKREGPTISISGRYVGNFAGTLRGNQLAGSWTATNRQYFVPFSNAPMKVTLTRDAATSATH